MTMPRPEVDTKETKNYIRIHNPLPWRQTYAYIDCREFMADKIFLNKNLFVRFKGDFKKDGAPYVIVTCAIWKKDEGRFLEAMKELQRKILIMGRPDYIETCDRIINLINKED